MTEFGCAEGFVCHAGGRHAATACGLEDDDADDGTDNEVELDALRKSWDLGEGEDSCCSVMCFLFLGLDSMLVVAVAMAVVTE